MMIKAAILKHTARTIGYHVAKRGLVRAAGHLGLLHGILGIVVVALIGAFVCWLIGKIIK